MTEWYEQPTRSLCNALQEMRDCLNHLESTVAIRHMKSLIEEVQTYANRMESSMETWKDITVGHNEKRKIKKEIDDLQQELFDKKMGDSSGGLHK